MHGKYNFIRLNYRFSHKNISKRRICFAQREVWRIFTLPKPRQQT